MTDALHLSEFIPPLLATFLYLLLYQRRWRKLRGEGRPVAGWRTAAFVTGVLMVTVVQLPPLDGLADSVLVAHMLQHIVLGDIASLLIVFGLTGTVLAPLLRTRASRAVRRVSHPLIALVLWASNLYAWHLPLFYQLAIQHDLVHALEHACLLWFGTLLWLSIIGPLPKPRWFNDGWLLSHVAGVRILGAVLANVFIWGQTVFYPVYEATDASHGLRPLVDQSLAGGVMMVEQGLLTTGLLAWLFWRWVRRAEDRQSLLDLAARQGVPLAADRAQRAASAGTAERLRERLLADSQPHRR